MIDGSIDYYEFKGVLGKVLFCDEISDKDDDLIFRPRDRRGMQDVNDPICIPDEDLRVIFDCIVSSGTENLMIYFNNRFEAPVKIDRTRLRPLEYDIESFDDEKGIKYQFGRWSCEFFLYMIIKCIDSGADNLAENVSRIRGLLLSIGDSDSVYNEPDKVRWKHYIQSRIKGYSVKIVPSKEKSLESLVCLSKNYTFEFMYKTGIALDYYIRSVDDLFHRSNVKRGIKQCLNLEICPRRDYEREIIEYYLEALESDNPFIQFLSYYHVLEYFYDELFKMHVCMSIRAELTHPDFSYLSDESLYGLFKNVKRIKTNERTQEGDEKNSLRYVLERYVDIGDLEKRLECIGDGLLEYYGESTVGFCNAVKINWNDQTSAIYSNLSSRIYCVRNSLVHSKSTHESRYRPYKNRDELAKEIPLIKCLSEMVIIGSGSPC